MSIGVKGLEKASGKKIRLIVLDDKLYFSGLVIWLLFNIKSFFGLSYEEYERFFFELMALEQGKSIKEPKQNRVKKSLFFYFSLMNNEWNSLMKDYTVTLNDDNEVLKIFVKRVKHRLE